MGLYDNFRSSFPLGPDFTGVLCQTKSLDCTMHFYWLDPAGLLWTPDYSGTSQIISKGNKSVNLNKRGFKSGYELVKTGKRGKMSPYRFTGIIDIYPASVNIPYTDLAIKFIDGELVDNAP